MRVLQICSKPPFPEVDGGCKATNNITQGLFDNGVDVKVLTISTHKHPFVKDKLPEEYVLKTQIESVFVDTRVKILNSFLNLFSSKSYNVVRFYSSVFEQLINQSLAEQEFDIVLLEGLYVTPYIASIRKMTKAKIVYRAHNVECEIWQRNAEQESNWLKRNYIKLLARKLRKYEQHILKEIDVVASITEKDQSYLIELGCKKPIKIVPFGIEIEKYQITKNKISDTLFHIGSMDWLPNQQAIKWFLDNVWNIINVEFLDLPFNVAGKNMPDWLLNWRQKNVCIAGEVDDAIQFINENKIMVVPLFSGSGMRIKIIEAMALGKVVIASSIAAEGINYENNKNIIIANTSKEYIAAIKKCLNEGDFVRDVGGNARELIKRNYDNRTIVNNLVQYFQELID